MGIAEILALCGVPSAITGFFFWLLKRQMTKQAKERETKDENREKLIISLIQTASASMALSEATARAVQRIPEAHCNGDMHGALNYAERVKRQQKDFLTKIGVHSIYE